MHLLAAVAASMPAHRLQLPLDSDGGGVVVEEVAHVLLAAEGPAEPAPRLDEPSDDRALAVHACLVECGLHHIVLRYSVVASCGSSSRPGTLSRGLLRLAHSFLVLESLRDEIPRHAEAATSHRSCTMGPTTARCSAPPPFPPAICALSCTAHLRTCTHNAHTTNLPLRPLWPLTPSQIALFCVATQLFAHVSVEREARGEAHRSSAPLLSKRRSAAVG